MLRYTPSDSEAMDHNQESSNEGIKLRILKIRVLGYKLTTFGLSLSFNITDDLWIINITILPITERQ